MDRDSKIYIPGHRGLVGSAIMRTLKEKGYANLVTRTSRQLDLRNQGATERFFKKEKPEYVFLAAAKVGGILANDTYKAEFIYDNIMIASNVIHASYKYGVKKLLNLGSSCIYPKMAPQPMKEEYLLTGELEPTNEPYAIAKISAIKLCRYYNEQYGTNFISVMPTNLYGPNDNFDLETSHALPALIRKFHLGKCLLNKDFNAIRKDLQKYPIRGYAATKVSNEDIINLLIKVGIKKLNTSNSSLNTQHLTPNTSDVSLNTYNLTLKTVVTLWGTGTPYREFLFVDDLADCCVFLMDHYDSQLPAPSSSLDSSDAMPPAPSALPRVSDSSLYAPSSMRHAKDAAGIIDFVNVGTGKDITIRDLAEIVKEIVGFKGNISFDPSRPDGTPKKLLDISRIKSLGWNPKVSLEEGIRNTYKWYLSTQQF